MMVELHLLFDHWLVCKLVRNLVYVLDCSLVAVMESADSVEFDFQLPS